MKKAILISNILIISFFLFLLGCGKEDSNEFENIEVSGTKIPLINLDGTWKFTMNPTSEFWGNDVNTTDWQNIQVPGECAMQGFPIKHDTPYVYKTKIQIPDDYEGKVVKLKFDGVYSYARVWINGEFIREHRGGFTAWECNISEHVQPGSNALLTVEITDKKDDLSYGSGYAKHQIGGILRSVWLKALPQNYLKYIYVETDLDENYKNAKLKIDLETSVKETAFVKFELYNPKGNELNLGSEQYSISNEKKTISINVENPTKWDAEHPYLYTLTTKLYDKDDNVTLSKTEKIGFREVEIIGNKMLVNGKPVKLRGGCRHDIHPLLGRSSTPEYDKKDVMLAKEANMNYIRTSHYPPSETFLNYCDKYGIYVEDESAVCFVNTHRSSGYRELKQSGPEFEAQYLSQVKEMVHFHRNHPSIVIWSTGNESRYDEQIQKSYDYIKSVDKTRPIMTSYPGTVPDSIKCYDILSMHYPSYTGDQWPQYGIGLKGFEYEKMPALFDEWAHVACYNLPTLRTDPNVREFWGQSLDSMWMNLFESEGGLGGAIWGYIDETFMMPESVEGFNDWWGIQEIKGGYEVYSGPTVGYGEWGIIDTWRRKKPEFWNTKKAYSPTKILLKEITDFQTGKEIILPVYNRFDHTNFNELKIEWEYNSSSGSIVPPDIKPHKKGTISIPSANWEKEKYLIIRFFQKDSELIDEYKLLLGSREIKLPELKTGNIDINESNDFILFSCKNYSAKLNRNTGLLKDVISQNDTIIKSGPYLNLLAFDKGDWATVPFFDKATNWKLDNCNYVEKEGIITIHTTGTFDDTIAVDYKMLMDEYGTLKISYIVSGAPETKLIRESGIKFITGNQFTKMKWDRDSYWTKYPEFHLGMPVGEIDLNDFTEMSYREFPSHLWEKDKKDFYYQGINKQLQLSKIALATKENIYSFALRNKNESGIKVFSSGDKSCRIEKLDQSYILNINSQWDYASLKWGNYQKNIKFENEFMDTVYLQIK